MHGDIGVLCELPQPLLIAPLHVRRGLLLFSPGLIRSNRKQKEMVEQNEEMVDQNKEIG